ncbi:putative ABC transporter permease [uncultured Ruthenibacterium sp.]|uniref:putative ABC transporter permease n=1 Tax=uncultured Ruthenibacterium sp. TaxID=1905347 RepID=UPI00349E8E3A
MTRYPLTQWFLFFFIYAFLGWVWESCLVSVQQHRWVNRGFLIGPFLPIYGFGALALLAFTLPVQTNPAMVFLFGMLGATVLEYVTGYGMEKLFHVKYWDYSRFRWNLNGYICLAASLCWGVFSLLLVNFLHPAVAHLVGQLPMWSISVLVAFLVAGITVDFLLSLRQARDVRTLLVNLSESRRRIKGLRTRLKVNVAVTPIRVPQPANRGGLIQRLNALREERRVLLRTLAARLEQATDEQHRTRVWAQSQLQLIKSEWQAMEERTDEMYQRAARHLRRNPHAASPQHSEVFLDVRSLFTEKPKLISGKTPEPIFTQDTPSNQSIG